MKRWGSWLASLWIAFATAGWGQEPSAGDSAAPTNTLASPPAAEASSPPSPSLQQLIEKINLLETRSALETQQSDRLKAQLYEAESKLEQVRETEVGNRSLFYGVLLLALALAAVSFIGLLAFCFYTVRRVTELTASLSTALPALHPSPLPVAEPPAAYLPVPRAVDANPPSAVARPQENRLLEVVDRLERKIEEIERAAHAESRPASSGPPPAVVIGDGGRNHAEADRLALLLNKAEAHAHLQQFDAALAAIEEALPLAPHDPLPLVKKGYVLEQQGRTEAALACYDRALQLDPNHSLAYLLKGGLLNRLQKYAEAIQCYDRALAARPPEPTR